MTDSTARLPIEALAVFPPPGMAAPNSFVFSRDSLTLFYLAARESANQQLYALDIPSGETRLAAAPLGDGSQEDKLSLEEELRRQRARMLEVGITQFQRAADADRLLIPLSGDVYVQDAPDSPLRKVVDCAGQSPAVTPMLSPDGTKIAYVQDGELYVVPAAGGEPKQITHGAREKGITNGLAEYAAQEELDRSMGFWWSPDSQCIVYAELDERHIPVYRIMHQGKDEVGGNAQEDHRYPFAGAENARVRMAVVGADGGEPLWLDVPSDAEYYIARVFWWNDGSPGAQLLNRAQNTVNLMRFDRQSGARTLILQETNPYWISFRTEHFALLNDDHFIWGSQRSGYNHLYFYHAGGQLIRPLTSGDWLVDDIIKIDENKGVVYFTATKDSPVEKHLYSVSLEGGDIRKITSEAGMHEVDLDSACRYFVDTFNALDTPPTVTLRSLENGAKLHTLHTPDDPRLAEYQLEPPELVTLQNRAGTTLYGALFHPPKRYGDGPFPTIVHVYGGPGPQNVMNGWKVTSLLQLQYLRQQGFLVFRLDNRGAARRGLEFEGALRHRMGSVEVDDQVDGVRWLIEQGLADPQRIGVTGWSYGGYMTLMCMVKAPEIFKVGVAGAPVTSWDGYDTTYTERYMSTPQDNPDGYREGSVMTHIDHLRGKLLLVHGLIDENVHFRHTARLMNALNRAHKRYDVLIFPDERHTPRRVADRTYMQERIVGYFEDNL
jgi:dipeptidyl-peptidase 4